MSRSQPEMAQAAKNENAYEAARTERGVFDHEDPLESIEEEPFAEGGFGSVHRGMYVIAIASTCITHCRC